MIDVARLETWLDDEGLPGKGEPLETADGAVDPRQRLQRFVPLRTDVVGDVVDGLLGGSGHGSSGSGSSGSGGSGSSSGGGGSSGPGGGGLLDLLGL